MAILSYNEILPKKIIVFNNEPYVVLSSHVFRKQQRKPVNITKIRGLKNNRVIEQTFHQSETVEEADLETKEITYIFSKGEEFWFHTKGIPSERFFLTTGLIGEQVAFLKSNKDYEAILYENEVINIKFPVKIELEVTSAMPAVKGNTNSGAEKEVIVETGAKLMVPMFINQGDIIRINTETGSYSERVTKT